MVLLPRRPRCGICVHRGLRRAAPGILPEAYGVDGQAEARVPTRKLAGPRRGDEAQGRNTGRHPLAAAAPSTSRPRGRGGTGGASGNRHPHPRPARCRRRAAQPARARGVDRAHASRGAGRRLARARAGELPGEPPLPPALERDRDRGLDRGRLHEPDRSHARRDAASRDRPGVRGHGSRRVVARHHRRRAVDTAVRQCRRRRARNDDRPRLAGSDLHHHGRRTGLHDD